MDEKNIKSFEKLDEMIYYGYEKMGLKKTRKLFNAINLAYMESGYEGILKLMEEKMKKEKEHPYCNRPIKIPTKTVHVIKFKPTEDVLENYARSTVTCNDLDFTPNKKVGRYLAQFYLEKELARKEISSDETECSESGALEEDFKKIMKETAEKMGILGNPIVSHAIEYESDIKGNEKKDNHVEFIKSGKLTEFEKKFFAKKESEKKYEKELSDGRAC